MSALNVRPVRSRSDRKRFIRFEWEMNSALEQWVPPLLADRRKLMDINKHPFYLHADVCFFLAERDGQVVGRIAAILNENHNREHREKIGFFGFFECVEEQEVADRLFAAACGWLERKGVSAVRGPASPSVNHEYGLLIDGFDDAPAVIMPYNPRYYARLIEGAGFVKERDLFTYKLDHEKVMTGKFVRVAGLIKERAGLTIRTLNMANYDAEVSLIRELYQKAWQRNWGAVPMTGGEFRLLAKDLKPVIRPELVLFAELRGKPIGFSLSLPDFNQVLRSNRRGWLLTAALRMLFLRKKINRIRILVLGVLPEHLRTGAGSLLMYETGRRSVSVGYGKGEAGWVLEDNIMMNRAAEFMNGSRSKIYRIYQKNISTAKEQ
jgi:GNAT superfamily N-acetyltransferase